MDTFARCFLLVFGQLAVGGFMALTAPPFHDLERGFYKSTAGVYLGAAFATLAGLASLLARPEALSAGRIGEVAAWTLFCLVASVYVASLWGERARLRARAFLFSLLSGLIALTASAQTFNPGGWVSVEGVLYPLSISLSALVLGAATCGMMLGHWYLIDPGLPIDPLMRMLRLFTAAVVLQVLIGAVALSVFWLSGTSATVANIDLLMSHHRALLLLRIAAGPVAALGLAFMIWRTLLIPQTMAATGLFYIATLAAIVGEMLGRFILFRTSLPL